MANPTSVYWVGADGNIYLKGPQGVQNVGAANGTGLAMGQKNNYNLSDNGFESNSLNQSVQAQRIADPNAPAPANPNNNASTTSDKSNDIAIQNAGLGAVDQQEASGLSAVDAALNGLLGQYDTEANTNKATYQSSSDTNQNNLQTNKQTALVNAAQGRQGLLGTLASLGALGGSGIELADRAVTNGANSDLTGAEGNFATNQSGLDTAYNGFTAEDAKRRADAATAATNAKAKVQNQAATNRQTFLGNLASDYSAEGNTAQANDFASKAAALYPTIASTSVPDTSNLSYSAAAFTPASLASYIAGAGNTTVSATPTANPGAPGAQLPSLAATTDAAKKKQTVLATA